MAESKLVHCVFFLNRACRKGDACPFLHDASLFAKVEDARREERKRTACVFHRRGTCTKGDACPFAHEGPPGVDAVAPRETKAVGAAAAGSSRPPPRARDEPDRTEPQPAPAQKKKKEFGSAARARARELGMLPSSNRGVGGGNDASPDRPREQRKTERKTITWNPSGASSTPKGGSVASGDVAAKKASASRGHATEDRSPSRKLEGIPPRKTFRGPKSLSEIQKAKRQSSTEGEVGVPMKTGNGGAPPTQSKRPRAAMEATKPQGADANGDAVAVAAAAASRKKRATTQGVDEGVAARAEAVVKAKAVVVPAKAAVDADLDDDFDKVLDDFDF